MKSHLQPSRGFCNHFFWVQICDHNCNSRNITIMINAAMGFVYERLTYTNSWVGLACLLFGVWVMLDWLEITSPPKFKGIFVIPGLPIIGNYFQIRNNPALKYMEWQRQYEHDVFQIRIGNKRIIVVNSFQAVADIWRQSAVNSRPFQYTFHNIVSSTKGFTIGTTPWGESYKRRKQVISQALNNQNLKGLVRLLDAEVTYTIKQIIKRNKDYNYQPSTNPTVTHKDISLLRYFQYFTLRTSILITYGFKLKCYKEDQDLCDRIIYHENKIIKFRSPIANLDDYFPILRTLKRLYNWRQASSIASRIARDEYMQILYDRFNQSCDLPEFVQSREHSNFFFKKNLISQYYFNFNNRKITFDELQSICLTMISAGLDNTPLNLDHLLGQLGYWANRKLQELAVNELLSLYQGDLVKCWTKVAYEMNSQFVIAIIKETLRYFTVLPLSLPRVTTKDITYKNITIPENATLFMNAYGANHDPRKFENPDVFNPHRWLDADKKLISENLIGHYAFGKGVRMCSGNILAFKEMYILVSRLLILFKIKSPADINLEMVSDPFKNNKNPQATSFDPKEFKVQLIPRILPGSDNLFNCIFK